MRFRNVIAAGVIAASTLAAHAESFTFAAASAGIPGDGLVTGIADPYIANDVTSASAEAFNGMRILAAATANSRGDSPDGALGLALQNSPFAGGATRMPLTLTMALVPEPSGMVFLGTGLLVVAAVVRRRHAHS